MGNENSTSVEAKESQSEKMQKESREDAKDDAIVRRSQRNGNIQNRKGSQKYPKFGQRINKNQTFEQVVAREDRYNPSIPIGWMKYKTDMVQMDMYEVVYFAGWRIILPKFLTWPQKRYLLHRIYEYGPSSVGFVTVGDTMMSEKILVNNRQALTAL